MATRVSVSEDRKTAVAKYKSEPILAEAPAYLTSYYGYVSAKIVLKEVLYNLDGSLLKSDKGD